MAIYSSTAGGGGSGGGSGIVNVGIKTDQKEVIEKILKESERYSSINNFVQVAVDNQLYTERSGKQIISKFSEVLAKIQNFIETILLDVLEDKSGLTLDEENLVNKLIKKIKEYDELIIFSTDRNQEILFAIEVKEMLQMLTYEFTSDSHSKNRIYYEYVNKIEDLKKQMVKAFRNN